MAYSCFSQLVMGPHDYAECFSLSAFSHSASMKGKIVTGALSSMGARGAMQS